MPIHEQRILVVVACLFERHDNPFDQLPACTLPTHTGIAYKPGKMPSPVAF
jgi:hypothetical protein